MDKKMNFKYFYGTEADQFSFYRIPKALFTNECFKDLSSDAKILYGLMLDRMSLSIKDVYKRQVQSGERPVLVVQADDYNQNAPTIIVAAVTSVIKKRYLPSHIILGEEFGLKKPSMVLLEQIRTVNREDLREYIGTVDDDKLFRQINATLKKTFGLWVYKPEGKENIRCLCPKCLNDYIHNPDYIVRRLDPFAKRKDRCDKCDGDGWDYVVTDRYSSKKEKRCKNV